MPSYKSWNPFHGIIETNRFWHARTLRTSFTQKLSDALYVLFGSDDHPGVVDYMTLFLMTGLEYTTNYLSKDERNFFLKVLGVISNVIFYVLLFTLQPMIIGATMVCWAAIAIPIIGIVHSISEYFAHNDKEEILEVEGVKTTAPAEEGESTIQPPITLGLFLTTHSTDLDGIVLSNITPKNDPQAPDTYELQFLIKKEPQNTDEPDYKYTTTLTCNAQSRQAYSFFKYNIGGLASTLESTLGDHLINRVCPV